MSSDYVHFALVESCRFMVRKLPAAKLICHNLPTTAWSSYLISPYQGTWKALCFHHGLATHTLIQRLVHVLFSGFVLHHFHPSLLDTIYCIIYNIYGYVYIYIYVYMYPSPRVGWCSATRPFTKRCSLWHRGGKVLSQSIGRNWSTAWSNPSEHPTVSDQSGSSP